MEGSFLVVLILIAGIVGTFTISGYLAAKKRGEANWLRFSGSVMLMSVALYAAALAIKWVAN